MNQAAIALDQSGLLSLSGVLDYTTGKTLFVEGKKLIASCAHKHIKIDCANVSKSSSVGVALLLAFMRDILAAKKHYQLQNIPPDMQQIAQVCGLQTVLTTQ